MKRRLKVICSPYTGYCFGVKRAMRLIEEGLIDRKGRIYTLGEVIHNTQAVDHLKSKGVIPVSSLDEIKKGDTLVVRAHGVHPDLIAEAEKRGIKLIDATCPFVERSQRYVKELSEKSYHVIVIGDIKHPEVRSIAGHAGDDAIIIDSVGEVEKIEPIEKAGVVIQTTFAREKAMLIINELNKKIVDLRVYDTICQATELRREATLELAENVDLMLVVGGRGSSNTRGLYQMCMDAGIDVRFIETAESINPSWFSECELVGLTTGTSTPGWILDEVLERMEEISKNPEGEIS